MKMTNSDFFDKFSECVYGIFDAKKADLPLLLEIVKESKKEFYSSFTETENKVFLQHFREMDKKALRNKIFFLFECNKCDVDFHYPSPLKPKQDELYRLTHIGFNQKWYCPYDYFELYVEELASYFDLRLVSTDCVLRHHFYAVTSY